ncbi:hypothetical protein A2U01_0039556, partial [Trifolium medium]|nr:hypothetical protein [Trifolium medium]
IAPGWEMAVFLRRKVEEGIVLHRIIGIGMDAIAAGLFVGCLAVFVAFARKN